MDRQIAAAREVEAAAALAEIKAKIAEFDFTVLDQKDPEATRAQRPDVSRPRVGCDLERNGARTWLDQR